MALDKKSLPASHPHNTETYSTGGRLTGYTATIAAAYYGIYRGKTKGEADPYYPYLFFEVNDVVLADGEPHDPMTLMYVAGYLSSKFGDGFGTMPSEDGVNPVGMSKDDYKALGMGGANMPRIEPGTEHEYRGRRTCGRPVKGAKRDKQGNIDPKSEAAPAWWVLDSIALAPVDGQDGPWEGWTPDGWSYDFVGMRCQFDSVDKPGADGVMLITRIFDAKNAGKPASVVTAAAAGKPAGSVASAGPSAAASTNGAPSQLDDEVAAVLVAAAGAQLGTPLAIVQAAQAVLKAKGPAAVQRIKEPAVQAACEGLALVDGKVWSFNGATMTLTAAS